jgi:hypothetical protein
MGIQDFGTIGADASVKQVIDALADLQDTLNFLLNGNLDVKNLRANSINADRIKANTITADRMDVQQLSAIAADLGTITAGIIYGAYIATANGTYPRIEFSSENKLLKAYLDATHYIYISPDDAGSPTFGFRIPGGGFCSMFMAPDDSGNFTINANGNLNLFSNTNKVKVNNWDGFLNAGTSHTLQQDLDALSARISALESATP